MVEEEDVVDTCWVALLVVLATMFLISAIEFCISPRLRLMSTAELLDVELDCFEDEEDEDCRAEDMRRCVEDVLAIRDVVVEELLLDDEDTCLLLELLLLRSFFCCIYISFIILVKQFLGDHLLLMFSFLALNDIYFL